MTALKPDFLYEIELTPNQVKIITDAFQTLYHSEQSFGFRRFLFPEESLILHILKEENQSRFNFTKNQLRLMFDWIRKTVQKKYGKAKVFIGEEKLVYAKLEKILNKK